MIVSSRVALYGSVGESMTHYDVDVDGFTLLKRNSVVLPANVQYAWPHPSRQYLYVVSSNRGSAPKATINHVSVFNIIPGSGALAPYGKPISLLFRPIHVSLDSSGSYVLITYNEPSCVSIHRINEDGSIGKEVTPREAPDCGIYAHQTRLTPGNRVAIVVARGNSTVGNKQEDPGALKLFRFRAGVLTHLSSIAPGAGYGFGPRHLDFHPTQPWVYVSLERQNKLCMFRMQGDTMEPTPVFTRETLNDPENIKPRQLAGTIHVHPNGRFVYVANRADWTVDSAGKAVFGGGENSIAVYAINPVTGAPTLVQHVDPGSINVRTFGLDPSGRMLVAASTRSMLMREGERLKTVQAGLSVFSVGDDGQLRLIHKYDVDIGNKTQFWMGMIGIE